MKPWDPPDPVRLVAGSRTPTRAAAAVDLPLKAVADGFEAPVPVALRLREAGLIDEGSAVQVLTATPPPVRDRSFNRAAVSLTPPPARARREGPRGRLQYAAPVREDAE